MSLQTIRAAFEVALTDAFAGMTPAVPCYYDNVQETPPNSEHVLINISYPSLTEPVICKAESNVELVRGNVQVSIYTARQKGMGRLEEMSALAAQTLVRMHDVCSDVNASCGQINGPDYLLSGDAPYAMASVSAPFTARG